MKDLAGRTAFVTGAASGIGLGVSTALAQAGVKVMMCDIEQGALDAAVGRLKDTNADVAGVIADVSLKAELQAAADATLGNLSKASSGLPQTLRELNALISDLRSAGAELGATARSAHGMIDGLAPDVRASAQQLHAITDRLADASSQIDRVIAENRQDLRSFARDGLPEIERFLREGRAAAADIRALANSLRENPAQLLYEPPERGMEIPR